MNLFRCSMRHVSLHSLVPMQEHPLKLMLHTSWLTRGTLTQNVDICPVWQVE